MSCATALLAAAIVFAAVLAFSRGSEPDKALRPQPPPGRAELPGTSSGTAPITSVAPTITTVTPLTTTPESVGAGGSAQLSVPSNPPPSAVGGDFPGPSSTGVPTGTQLESRGDMVVTAAGTVVDAVDITGTLEIEADGVVVKRSRIRGSANAVVRVADGVTGVVLEDVEVDGLGASGASGGDGIVGPATIRRANIHGVENGVVPDSGSVIEDSWIHDLSAPGSPHYDGVQIDGDVADIVIRHNSISVPDQTSAVMIDNYLGAVDDVTVDSNLLTGGAYTVYSDGQFSSAPITNVRIVDNRFGWHQFGYILRRNSSLSASDGNVDHATGEAISL